MEALAAHELFRADAEAYRAALWELDEAYEWSEDELGLVNGVAFFIGQDTTEGVPQTVAAGYLAGRLEAWRRPDLDEHRLGTDLRDSVDPVFAERFNDEWDVPEWTRIISRVFHFRHELERFALDPQRLEQRLDLQFENFTERMFAFEMTEETREFWHTAHRLGTALCLYVTWLALMDDLGIPEHERWTENLEARPLSDALVSLDLPLEIDGCTLSREDWIGGYEINSRGRLGGRYWMRFRALGDTAKILVCTTEGRLWTRTLDVPEHHHVDVLRKLGFQQMVFPNGKRYELRLWPGIRRLKD